MVSDPAGMGTIRGGCFLTAGCELILHRCRYELGFKDWATNGIGGCTRIMVNFCGAFGGELWTVRGCIGDTYST